MGITGKPGQSRGFGNSESSSSTSREIRQNSFAIRFDELHRQLISKVLSALGTPAPMLFGDDAPREPREDVKNIAAP
jgi:hypothetical protein